MPKRGFVPDSYQNLHDWAQNYANQVPPVATRITWPSASVTALQAELNTLVNQTAAILNFQHSLDTAVGQLNADKANLLAQIRLATKSLKATPGFTEGDAKTLGVYTTPETFDPNTYQPVVTATARHGYVEIMAEKHGADSLNLYVRPAGTPTWALMSAKRARFPTRTTRPRPPGRPCRCASTWRWASWPTRRSAIRATLRARCFKAKTS